MEGNTDREQDLWEKQHRPDQWLSVHSRLLDSGIKEYNEVAEQLGVDIIVAFKMTVEERDEFLSDVNKIQEEKTNERREKEE